MATINLSDRDQRKMVIEGFGSLNEFESPSHVSPHDLISVSNMDVRTGHMLATRGGQRFYHDRAYADITEPVNLMLRYRPRGGQKRIIIRAGNVIHRDDDRGKFDPVFSLEGTAWMSQYDDVVLCGSDTRAMSAYDVAAGTSVSPVMDGRIHGAMIGAAGGPTGVTSGGRMANGKYIYRFTFDITVGGVFLGETGPARYLYDTDIFVCPQIDLSGGTNVNRVDFYRANDIVVSNVPTYVSAINYYRSPALTAFPVTTQDEVREYSELFWVGSVTMDDYRAATVASVIFSDKGFVTGGRQIRRSCSFHLPRSASTAWFKNRLWMASPYLANSAGDTWTYYPDRIAFSANEARGPEPFVFFPESMEPVGVGSTEPITLINWRDQILFAFKETSMWALAGADREFDVGIPDVAIKQVSGSIGLRSRRSLVDTEYGLVWDSNRGPYIYDGTIPRPLKAERVQKTFSKIPKNVRSDSVAIYHTDEREYVHWHAIPDGTTGSSYYKRAYSKYNFFTQKWTNGRSPVGIGSAVEVRDNNKSYVLLGVDERPTLLAQSRSVLKWDTGTRDGLGTSVATAAIPFSFQTGFLDDGRPYEDKRFQAIIVESTAQVPLTVDYIIDSKYDSRPNGTGVVLEPAVAADTLVWDVGNWGEKKWGSSQTPNSPFQACHRFHDTIPVGKSISIIISGENNNDPTEIYAITVFYKSEGVRENV